MLRSIGKQPGESELFVFFSVFFSMHVLSIRHFVDHSRKKMRFLHFVVHREFHMSLLFVRPLVYTLTSASALFFKKPKIQQKLPSNIKHGNYDDICHDNQTKIL